MHNDCSSLPDKALPALLVVGSALPSGAIPQSLIDAVARGLLRLERVPGVHAAAARIASGLPLAGVLLDLSTCRAADVTAISHFDHAGVVVWLLAAERNPARAEDAAARGGRRWTLTNFEHSQARQAADKADLRPPVHMAGDPDRNRSLENGTMNAPELAGYQGAVEEPLVSNEELRALLGASE